MKASIISKYIDNKIRSWINDKKDMLEITLLLDKGIVKTEKMRHRFKEYVDKFSKKRINDILFLKSVDRFRNFNDIKLLNLIKLKDKLEGNNDFEI